MLLLLAHLGFIVGLRSQRKCAQCIKDPLAAMRRPVANAQHARGAHSSSHSKHPKELCAWLQRQSTLVDAG